MLVKQLKMKQEKKGRFLGMLLGTLDASLLGNLVTCKLVKQSKIPGCRVLRAGDWTVRVGQDF